MNPSTLARAAAFGAAFTEGMPFPGSLPQPVALAPVVAEAGADPAVVLPDEDTSPASAMARHLQGIFETHTVAYIVETSQENRTYVDKGLLGPGCTAATATVAPLTWSLEVANCTDGSRTAALHDVTVMRYAREESGIADTYYWVSGDDPAARHIRPVTCEFPGAAARPQYALAIHPHNVAVQCEELRRTKQPAANALTFTSIANFVLPLCALGAMFYPGALVLVHGVDQARWIALTGRELRRRD